MVYTVCRKLAIEEKPGEHFVLSVVVVVWGKAIILEFLQYIPCVCGSRFGAESCAFIVHIGRRDVRTSAATKFRCVRFRGGRCESQGGSRFSGAVHHRRRRTRPLERPGAELLVPR